MNYRKLILFCLLIFCGTLMYNCKKDKIPYTTPKPQIRLPELKQDEVVSIPVIFHIIHNGEDIGKGNNLNYKIVQRQMDNLNNSFRNIIQTSTDIKIEFRLATTNTNNETLQEPGVERIYNSQTEFDYKDLFDKQKCPFVYESMWDVNKYINVWIAPIKDRTSAATLPYTATYNPLQGLVSLDEYWFDKQSQYIDGIVLNAITIKEEYTYFLNYYTLTHEMGHYFGLFHVFNDSGCTKDDYCGDTYHYDRSLYSLDMVYNRTTCDGEIIIADNFMDYDFNYKHRFTENQKERMRHVAAYSPYRGILRYSKTKSNKETKPTDAPPKPKIIKCVIKEKYLYSKH